VTAIGGDYLSPRYDDDALASSIHESRNSESMSIKSGDLIFVIGQTAPEALMVDADPGLDPCTINEIQKEYPIAQSQ
jgi:hypothetical protein